MWWQWLIFGLIFVLIPIGLIGIKDLAVKNNNYTKKQIEIAQQKMVVYSFFYWMCDFFYMTFLLDNLTWRLILGSLIMVIIFYNLSKAFVNGNTVLKFGLVQDFIIGLILTVYLIYIIPNNNLKQIIIPILSAVYGGLLTLVGVAWTIKKSDKDRKEEEKQKAKPYLKNYLRSYQQDQDVKIEFIDFNRDDKLTAQGFILYLHNISKSILFVSDIIIQGNSFPIHNVVLEGDGKIELHIGYYAEKISTLKNIQIIGHDILNNYYSYKMESDNFCEQYESTQIGLPQDFDYNKIK